VPEQRGSSQDKPQGKPQAKPKASRAGRAGGQVPAPTMDLQGLARKQRLVKLLDKLRAGAGLSPAEQRELAAYEGSPVEKPQAEVVIPASQARVMVATRRHLAAVFAVDLRSVERWVNSTWWPRGQSVRGPFDLGALVPAFIAARVQQLQRPVDGRVETARARRLTALADQAEMETAARRGTFIALDKVREANNAVWLRVRDLLLAADRKFPGLVDLLGRDLDMIVRDLEGLRSKLKPGAPAKPAGGGK